MKVLIVEDEGWHAEKIKNNLIALGFDDIIIAQSSDEAYTYLNTENQFDFGIFDIELREKIDGIQLGLEFFKKTNLPIIFATQYVEREDFIARLSSAGVSHHFFINKTQLENQLFLEEIIDDVLENFESPSPSKFQQLQYVSRKIGFLSGERGTRNYTFYKKDEIIFIEGRGDETEIHLSNTEVAKVRRNVGNVGNRISKVFYNIVRIDRSYYINLEQIDRLEGATLYFTNDLFIRLSSAAMQYLKTKDLLLVAKR